MITAGTCFSFLLECLDGVHQPDDDYKIALYSSAADIGPSSARYTTAGEVNAVGYEVGGATLSGRSTSPIDGGAVLNFTDQQWTGTISARGCMVYNSSKNNRSVVVGDFGDDVRSTNDVFTAHFPQDGCVVIQIRRG